jgi:hypothetical protein
MDALSYTEVLRRSEMGKSCENCKWFTPVEPGEVYADKLSPYTMGHCERYPAFYTDHHLVPGGWPAIIRTGVCGEYSPKIP